LEEINRFLFDWLAGAETTHAQVWGYHVSLGLFDLRLGKRNGWQPAHRLCEQQFHAGFDGWQTQCFALSR
jgi:hypothetical protein